MLTINGNMTDIMIIVFIPSNSLLLRNALDCSASPEVAHMQAAIRRQVASPQGRSRIESYSRKCYHICSSEAEGTRQPEAILFRVEKKVYRKHVY